MPQQHSLTQLHRAIVYFGILFILGTFLPSILAILCKKVTPYVPYISEGAAQFPESGIFTICMVIASFFSLFIMSVRFLYVDGITSRTGNSTHIFMNRISLFIGVLAMISLTVAIAYPTTSITQVHNTSAGGASICLVLYMFFHAWLSLLQFPDKRIPKLRLVIVLFSVIAIILTAVFGVLGSIHWTSAHWVGSKTPADEGFIYYTVSASAEWILTLLYFLFISTYFHEFKGLVFHFRLDTQLNRDPRAPKIVITCP